MACRLQRNGPAVTASARPASRGKLNQASVREKYYPNSLEWDEILAQYHSAGMRVLEVGSGSGRSPQNTNYPLGPVFGTDLEPTVLENPNLIGAWQANFYNLSVVQPGSFDLIYSHMVAEHVENPTSFIEEQIKLLAPGGVIIHSTLSGWSIPAMANRVLPRFLQLRLLRLMRSKRSPAQVYPASYRMNSKSQLAHLADDVGVRVEAVFVSQPLGYLKFSRRLLAIASLLLSRLERLLPQLRTQLVIVIRRCEL